MLGFLTWFALLTHFFFSFWLFKLLPGHIVAIHNMIDHAPKRNRYKGRAAKICPTNGFQNFEFVFLLEICASQTCAFLKVIHSRKWDLVPLYIQKYILNSAFCFIWRQDIGILLFFMNRPLPVRKMSHYQFLQLLKLVGESLECE
jgi:hypothetical protein